LNSLSTQQGAEVDGSLKRGRISAAVIVAVAAAALSGCAGLAKRSPEQAVQERAQARWDALVKGDVSAAYGFLSPGSRAVITPQGYEGTIRRGFWKSAKVDKVECGTPQSCEASATIEYDYQGQRIKSPLRETWIQEGADWWYVQK
jgi:hypothetical protein